MTGKERAIKRSEAHNLKPIFQLGKGGINDLFKEISLKFILNKL